MSIFKKKQTMYHWEKKNHNLKFMAEKQLYFDQQKQRS